MMMKDTYFVFGDYHIEYFFYSTSIRMERYSFFFLFSFVLAITVL